MRKRPLCLMAIGLIAVIFCMERLGVSWFWRSPAGPLPERLARQEETEAGSAATGSAKPGSTVAGSEETGSAVSGSAETESPVTGSAEIGSAVSGSAEAGSPVTGSAKPGNTVTKAAVTAEGTVCQQEELIYQDQITTYLYLKETYLTIDSKQYPIRKIKCEIKGRQEALLGRRLAVTGVLMEAEEPKNPGEFDRLRYERGRKVDFHLEQASILRQIRTADVMAKGWEAARNYCKNLLEAIFPAREAGILEAMLLGEKEQLDPEVKDGFLAAGISHIIAISGLHISMLGMGIWGLLRRLGLPLPVSCLASLSLLVLYGFLIGSPTTACRALLMFGLMLGARLAGRTYDLLSALAAAAILLLLDNPDLLFDSGFQLSFAAVAGMGSYGAVQAEIWNYIGDELGLPGEKAGSLSMGLSLWLFTLPVVLCSFYQVSVLGIFCNLLVLPLMSAVLGSGFLALGLGMMNLWVGSLAGIPAYWIVRFYEWLGTAAERVTIGVWTPGKPSFTAVVFYYLTLAFSCLCCKKIKEAGVNQGREGNGSSQPGPKRRRILAALGLIQAAALAFLLFLMEAPWENPSQIAVLDVGQGDGIVLQEGHTQILVDGGSSSRSQIGQSVLLPYLKYEGISNLEGLLLTHTDEDHINGALEVLEEAKKGWLTVEQVWMPLWMKDTPKGQEVIRLAQEARISWDFLKTGDTLQAGKARIQVLHPDETDYTQDPNAGSLVFTWESGIHRALFTGDLTGEEEERLLEILPECDILKVAHHGSRYSTTEAFLERVRPRLALISCGRKNRYGHPGEETLDRLEEYANQIWRTDQSGALIFSLA